MSSWACKPLDKIVALSLGKGAVCALAILLLQALLLERGGPFSSHAARAVGAGLFISAFWFAGYVWVRHAARRGRRSWILG